MGYNLLRLIAVLFGLYILTHLPVIGCGGGGEASPDTELDNPLISISTLKDIAVDQFAFYLTDEIFDPDIEVWIGDANDTDDANGNKLLLCSHSGLGMEKVNTEGVLYGNLNAAFKKITESDDYEGRLFKVGVYQNNNESCLNSSGWFVVSDMTIGISDPVNYDTLISEPIFATNGTFFVRFKEARDAESHPLPLSIIASLPKDRLMIDQVHISNTYLPYADLEIYISTEVTEPAEEGTEGDETKSWKMIGCSDDDTGLGSFDSTEIIYGKLLADIVDENNLAVNFSEHTGKTVKVVMVDNGGESCPKDINTSERSCWWGCTGGDIVIGESQPVLWDELPGKQIWLGENLGYVTFNNVVQ